MVQTDYALHDVVYARKRASEQSVGWNDAEGTAQQLARLAEWTADWKPGRLLELGCGAGDQSLWFAERGFDVAGVDISVNAIEWAREKASARALDAEFVTGSVLELPFERGAFDYVLDGACWHCIVGDDRRLFLSEAAAALRPGGLFTGITMVNGCRYDGPMEYDAKRRIQFMGGVAVRYWTTADEAIADLEAAGLRIVRFEERPAHDEQMEDLLLIDAMRP